MTKYSNLNIEVVNITSSTPTTVHRPKSNIQGIYDELSALNSTRATSTWATLVINSLPLLYSPCTEETNSKYL